MIKKYIFFIGVCAIAGLLSSCGGGESTAQANAAGDSGTPKVESGYLIEGSIGNAAGQPVYLDKVLYNQGQPLDTAIIAEDGSFTLKGDISQKGMYNLKIGPGVGWMIVLDDKSALQFTSDVQNPGQYSVTGGPAENQILVAFINNVSAKNSQMSEANQRLQQAYQSGNQQEFIAAQQEVAQLRVTVQRAIANFTDTVSSPLLKVFGASSTQLDQNNAERMIKIAEQLKAQNLNSDYVNSFVDVMAKVKQQLEAQKQRDAHLAIGKPAPDFDLKSPKGKNYKLSDLKGKVVLIDFWASWCRPCRAENPNLVRTYEKYKDKGFTVYSVSLDKNMDRWVQAINQDNLVWEYHGSNLKAWQEPVAKQYNVSSIPATFLVDEKGMIIAKNLRGPTLEVKLQEYFGS